MKPIKWFSLCAEQSDHNIAKILKFCVFFISRVLLPWSHPYIKKSICRYLANHHHVLKITMAKIMMTKHHQKHSHHSPFLLSQMMSVHKAEKSHTAALVHHRGERTENSLPAFCLGNSHTRHVIHNPSTGTTEIALPNCKCIHKWKIGC